MSNIVDKTIDQGSSYTFTFNLLDALGGIFDLTGYTARLMVRKSYGSTTPVISASVGNGLAIAASTGVITWSLTPADTSGIAFASKEDDTLDCVYDLEIVSPAGKVFKPAKGTLSINREVTR